MTQTQALTDSNDMSIDELRKISNDYKKNRNELPLIVNGKKVGKIAEVFLSRNTLYGKVFYD